MYSSAFFTKIYGYLTIQLYSVSSRMTLKKGQKYYMIKVRIRSFWFPSKADPSLLTAFMSALTNFFKIFFCYAFVSPWMKLGLMSFKIGKIGVWKPCIKPTSLEFWIIRGRSLTPWITPSLSMNACTSVFAPSYGFTT